MNKMSILLLIFWVNVVLTTAVGASVGGSSVREVHAQSAGAAAANPAQRRIRQHFVEKPARPFMRILLENVGRERPGAKTGRL